MSEHAKEPLIIRNEEDAWTTLEAATADGARFEDVEVRFDGWPIFAMDATGRDWHSTVPTRIMPPLIEVQKDISRAFARAQYGSSSLHRLRDEERDSLEVVVEVRPGSSLFQAPLDGQLNHIFQTAVQRMNGTEAVITVIGLGLLITSAVMYKAWLANRQEEKKLQTQVQLSEQETKRLQIMTTVSTKHPSVAQAHDDVVTTTNKMLKATRTGDTMTMRSVSLDASTAHDLVQPERAQAKQIELAGQFRIIGNKTDLAHGFRVTVERLSDGLQLKADVLHELPWDDREAVKQAEWSKSPVALSIDAEMLRDKITRAVVTSAQSVNPDQT